MNMRLLAVLLINTLLFSCSAEKKDDNLFKKTKSGFLYKIISAASGDSVQYRDRVKVHLHQYIDDSLLATTVGKMPQYIEVTNELKEFDYTELLQQMKVNDSAVCLFPTAEIIRRAGKDAKVPAFLQKGKQIRVQFKILARFAEEADAMFDAEKTRNGLIGYSGLDEKTGYEQAGRIFDSLLQSLPVKPVKLPEGVYVAIKEKGKGGKLKPGQEVAVIYKGMLVDGRVFEEKTKNNPFVIHAGKGEAVKGFDAAIASLSMGDKARLYIPAVLGYGSQKAGDYIPAFSNLIFDVEIAEPIVKTK